MWYLYHNFIRYLYSFHLWEAPLISCRHHTLRGLSYNQLPEGKRNFDFKISLRLNNAIITTGKSLLLAKPYWLFLFFFRSQLSNPHCPVILPFFLRSYPRYSWLNGIQLFYSPSYDVQNHFSRVSPWFHFNPIFMVYLTTIDSRLSYLLNRTNLFERSVIFLCFRTNNSKNISKFRCTQAFSSVY